MPRIVRVNSYKLEDGLGMYIEDGDVVECVKTILSRRYKEVHEAYIDGDPVNFGPDYVYIDGEEAEEVTIDYYDSIFYFESARKLAEKAEIIVVIPLMGTDDAIQRPDENIYLFAWGRK